MNKFEDNIKQLVNKHVTLATKEGIMLGTKHTLHLLEFFIDEYIKKDKSTFDKKDLMVFSKMCSEQMEQIANQLK